MTATVPHEAKAALSRAQLVVVGAALLSATAMSVDVTLASLPVLAREFSTTKAAAQATLSGYAAGLALSHLFLGGLADHYGRRPVALGCFVVYGLASLVAALAPDLAILTLARIVQGGAAAGGAIITRAIVRDLVPAREGGRTMSLISACMGIVPLFAPSLGALLQGWVGWRGTFVWLTAYSLIVIAMIAGLLKETLAPANRSPQRIGNPFAALGAMVHDRRFLLAALALLLSAGGFFSWISTAPFLLIDQLGFRPVTSMILLSCGSFAYICGSLISMQLAHRIGALNVVLFGVALMVAGAIVASLVLRIEGAGPVTVGAGMIPYYVSWGVLMPTLAAVAVGPFPHMAGQASAWVGAAQMTGGVVLSMLTVRMASPYATPNVMLAASLGLAVAAVLLALHERRGH